MKSTALRPNGMSIRSRVLIGLAVLVLTMATVLVSTIWHHSFSQRELYALTDDYYETSNFMSAYLSANNMLETLVRTDGAVDTSLLRGQYDAYETAMEQHLYAIQSDIAAVDTEWYLLIRALKATLGSYTRLADTLFDAWDKDDTAGSFALYYDSLEPCGAYLQQYSSQLLETEIRSGQNIYAQFNRANLRFTLFQICLCLLIVAIGFVYARLNVNILRPVFDMIDSAKQIAGGSRNLPDIPYAEQNEMGQLVHAFNRMKNATGELVQALEEKNRMESQLNAARIRHAEQEQLLQQAVVLQLRSQINPHFLFNTLNTIARTARSEDAAKTEKLIFALSRLFRGSLHAEDEGFVPLAREIGIVNEYMDIQRARFGDRLNMDWRVHSNVDPESVLVPSFFLQPLVENAIIHGLEARIAGGFIRVRIRMDGAFLHISVCDNGAGISTDKLNTILAEEHGRDRRFSGIGVRNVSSRIRMLDERNTFCILSKPGRGTCVRMRIYITDWEGSATV